MSKTEMVIGGSLKPAAAETTLDQCPPGLFLHDGRLGLMTEYSDLNGPQAYVVESGEYWWGGTNDPAVRILLRVLPVQWVENNKQEAQPGVA